MRLIVSFYCSAVNKIHQHTMISLIFVWGENNVIKTFNLLCIIPVHFFFFLFQITIHLCSSSCTSKSMWGISAGQSSMKRKGRSSPHSGYCHLPKHFDAIFQPLKQASGFASKSFWEHVIFSVQTTSPFPSHRYRNQKTSLFGGRLMTILLNHFERNSVFLVLQK